MLAIVDNGNAAELARYIRGEKEVIGPKDKINHSGIILSDGDMKNQKVNIDIIKKANVPVLAVGAGYVFLVSAFGMKPKDMKFEKMERLKLLRSCPLTLDMKKAFSVVQSCTKGFDEVPEGFDVIASSPKYEFQIIENTEKPLFGVHFSPEKGGDGLKVLENFEKFVDVWKKYHR
ncbi:hypothetical protein HY501_01890 [Candidatus Woesearchaeota archaeon]|nr:hypothetical protein [Candidatus Woesearchaeota archaeon]